MISTYTLIATTQKLRVWFDRAPEIGWIDSAAVHVKRPRKVGIRFSRPCSPELVVTATGAETRHLANLDDEETTNIGANPTIDWAPSRRSELAEQDVIRELRANFGL